MSLNDNIFGMITKIKSNVNGIISGFKKIINILVELINKKELFVEQITALRENVGIINVKIMLYFGKVTSKRMREIKEGTCRLTV